MKIRATSHPSGLQGLNLEFGVCNQWNFGLDRSYRLPAHKIAAAVERMLQTDVLVIENEQEVFTAMHRHDRTQGGAGLVRRCCHRCTRRQSRLLLHPDIRPQGGAATRLRTRLTCAVLARSIFSSD